MTSRLVSSMEERRAADEWLNVAANPAHATVRGSRMVTAWRAGGRLPLHERLPHNR
jgi:hypothetical protein